MDNKDNDLLTVGAAGKLLGVSERTVRNYCDIGLKFVRTNGGHKRFRRCDIEAFKMPERQSTISIEGMDSVGNITLQSATYDVVIKLSGMPTVDWTIEFHNVWRQMSCPTAALLVKGDKLIIKDTTVDGAKRLIVDIKDAICQTNGAINELSDFTHKAKVKELDDFIKALVR